jgi:glyoxylase-like metal-dependent hydrolase (beta-lactamase superfamily II)
MVLPRISTNVSVFDLEPEGDPLGGFLESLGRYDDLPADTLVLPSHGKPFRGLPIRLRQLREHHAARLDEVMQVCAQQARSAADIVPIMFRRPLDTHQMTFALGEALAHLHYLWYRGQLRRVTDADGIYRFEAAVSAF